MDSSMSPADVMALSNSENGYTNPMWMLIFLAMIWGWGGNGFGGNGNGNAIQADVNRGFDNQNLQSQTRDILAAVTNGTAQGIAATNQTFHDTLMANQNLYNEVQRDVATLGVGQANLLANQNQCCSSTQQLIMQGNATLAAQIAQNEYNNAIRDAATNANFTAQINGLKDTWYEDKIAGLQQEVTQLRGVVGSQGIQAQLDSIQQNMVTYPRGWTYNAGTSPYCNCGNGCCNNI